MKNAFRRSGLRYILVTSAVALAGNVSAAAYAQQTAETGAQEENGTAGFGEIIVTAQKRGENIQSVPIAVTAVSGEQLVSAGIQNTQDLSQIVPGLNMLSTIGFMQPHLRGIGQISAAPGIESPIATYVDGVYYASAPGSQLNLINIQSLEVYKGPQGTLFGRNATGGVINITTRNPGQETMLDASLKYGNYDTVSGTVYLETPLADALSVGIAGYYSHQGDGFGINVANGRDVRKTEEWAARAKFLWTLGDSTTFTFIADHSGYNSDAPSSLRPAPGTIPALGGPFPGGAQDVNSDVNSFVRVRQAGASLTIEHDFSFAQFRSITAYRETQFDTAFDADGTPVPGVRLDITARSNQFTQELQLLSRGDGPFKWVVGAFYIRAEDKTGGGPSGLLLAPVLQINNVNTQVTESPAVFGQASYAFGTGTTVTAGLRYTSEDRSFDGVSFTTAPFPIPNVPVNQKQSIDQWTWRLSIDQAITDDILAYISYNRGFKTGGYNPFAPDPTGTIQPALLPEKLDAYEIGLKTLLLDRRLRANFAAFYYDYTNLQQARFFNNVEFFFNGPAAKVYGLDVEMNLLVTDNLTVNLGGEYLEHEFTTFPNAPYVIPNPAGGGNAIIDINGAGKPLPATPDFTVSLGAQYRIPTSVGQFILEGNVAYNSGWYPTTSLTRDQDAYEVVNAAVTWRSADERFSISLWGRNLTDRVYASNITPAGAMIQWTAAAPRTYGFTARVKF